MTKKDINKEIGESDATVTYSPSGELSVDVKLGRPLTDDEVAAIKAVHPDSSKGAEVMIDKNSGTVSFEPGEEPTPPPRTSPKSGRSHG